MGEVGCSPQPPVGDKSVSNKDLNLNKVSTFLCRMREKNLIQQDPFNSPQISPVSSISGV